MDQADRQTLEQLFRQATEAASSNRREDAFRLMSQAADAGLAAASYFAGIWLIVAFGVMPDAGKGIARLEQAAAKGFSPARSALAAVYANGCGVPDDWEAAKAEFCKALALGWPNTFREAAVLIDLLGGDRSAVRGLLEFAHANRDPLAGPLLEGVDAPPRIVGLGEATDIIRALPDPQPPAPEAFLKSPKALVFRKILTPLACRYVRLISPPRLAVARVVHKVTGALVDDPDRTGFTGPLYLSDLDIVTAAINRLACKAAGVPQSFGEEMMILKYLPGQEYKPHYDYLEANPAGLPQYLEMLGQRVQSLLIYLNDDYQGGETEFPRVNARFRGGLGDALLYANANPDGSKCEDALHAGRPVASGEKWIITKWMRNKSQFHSAPPPAGAKRP